MLQGSEILFMGIGRSAVLWYRCALPAQHLGADWVGVRGQPPGVQVLTGLVRNQTVLPSYDDYRVVIIQQPYGRAWLKQINALRARGIKVLYEIDDYIHGVAKQKFHDFSKDFTKERLRDHELCMRACDGLIASTEYVGRRYRKFNPNVYICPNGIDERRYALTKPRRSTVNIGWAGATGHVEALLPWLNAALPVMKDLEKTCLVIIGHPEIARVAGTVVGEHRAIGIPFIPMECYPAAMCMFDIALAPAGTTGWYRGKSDLRWLEASALGIPSIADPYVYPEIQHDITGYHAETPKEMAALLRYLVHDGAERERVGKAAREYVTENRTSEIAAAQWFEVCGAVVGEYESVSQLGRRA